MTLRTRKSYAELSQLETFDERFDYLVLRGHVGRETFGHARHLNQEFYASSAWRRARRLVIIRDRSCDLGIEGYEIYRGLYIHHINPMTVEDLVEGNPDNLDPDNLITVSLDTHNAIHYGNERQLPRSFTERRPGDTWP